MLEEEGDGENTQREQRHSSRPTGSTNCISDEPQEWHCTCTTHGHSSSKSESSSAAARSCWQRWRENRRGKSPRSDYHTDMGMQVNRFSVLKCILVSVSCALSVCDGMGCGLISLRANNVDSLDRYLAVEISEDARRIAKNANPYIKGKLNIDHSWHTNLYNITEPDIEALGHDSIKLFLAGPPCQDFSKLRLIVRSSAKRDARELRPGLDQMAEPFERPSSYGRS